MTRPAGRVRRHLSDSRTPRRQAIGASHGVQPCSHTTASGSANRQQVLCRLFTARLGTGAQWESFPPASTESKCAPRMLADKNRADLRRQLSRPSPPSRTRRSSSIRPQSVCLDMVLRVKETGSCSRWVIQQCPRDRPPRWSPPSRQSTIAGPNSSMLHPVPTPVMNGMSVVLGVDLVRD
jgi:hypothetical protein